MGVFDTIDSDKIELTMDGAILLSAMTVALADLEDKDMTSELMGVMLLDAKLNYLEFGNTSEDYDDAFKVWTESSANECIHIVNNILNDDQKLTAMVNMIDFAMADGELGAEEKIVLNAFSEAFNIDDNFIEAAFNIISIKNTIYQE
jgi:hypothetical protein